MLCLRHFELMDPVLETLMLPLVQGALPPVEKAAFLNARYHTALENFKDEHIFLQQHFRPYADELQSRGFKVTADVEHASVPLVMLLLPKNADEAKFFIARGLSMLEKGGKLLCAAANDAGGGRLKKLLESFGLDGVASQSKNHARVCWGTKNKIDTDAAEQAIEKGSMQPILKDEYVSMPGLFSWNKIDLGSVLLAQFLPSDLKGRGADFGCGYGFLSRHVLENCSGVEHMCCIDADARAVQMAKENLKKFSNVDYLWADLTAPLSAPGGLDFIVMNPPFHEGKTTSAAIGLGFITTAAQSLKPGGQLWMVANANLPYERTLAEAFTSVQKITEGQGFKVYKAS